MTNLNFKIDFTENSLQQLTDLKNDPSRQRIAKAVVKSIGFMIGNIRHPSLHTHINMMSYQALMEKKFSSLMLKIKHPELIVFFGIMAREKIKLRLLELLLILKQNSIALATI